MSGSKKRRSKMKQVPGGTDFEAWQKERQLEVVAMIKRNAARRARTKKFITSPRAPKEKATIYYPSTSRSS